MAYPIYPGMDVKFQVTTEWEDFQLTEDPFEIVIKNGYGRMVKTIKKADCFWDEDGRYYFTLKNVQRGIYRAYFKGDYEDEDYDTQRATITDLQDLLIVPSNVRESNGGNITFTPSCKHKVHYRLVTIVSIDGDDYLADCNGKYILTQDGKRICFKSDKSQEIEDMGKVRLDTLTGDEFKKLIEGNNPDGQIDTIPEMLRAAEGISDDGTTIKEEVAQQIDDSQEENEATDDDIDEIFNE